MKARWTTLLGMVILVAGDLQGTSVIHRPIKTGFFVDPWRGWAAGEAGLVETVDGGESWTLFGLARHDSPLPYAGLSAAFVGIGNIWASPAGKRIIATNDSGASWTDITPSVDQWCAGPSARRFFTSLGLVDTRRGWAVANCEVGAKSFELIFTTLDGGSHWKSSPLGEPSLANGSAVRAMTFLQSGTGWMIRGGELFESVDQGESWDRRLGDQGGRIEAVSFLDELLGWAVGSNGVVWRTEDGGETWTLLHSEVGLHFTDVHFTSQTTGLLVSHCYTARSAMARPAEAAILKTQDGGLSWRRALPLPTTAQVTWFFLSPAEGWIWLAGDASWNFPEPFTVLHTRDGGATWRELFRGKPTLPPMPE